MNIYEQRKKSDMNVVLVTATMLILVSSVVLFQVLKKPDITITKCLDNTNYCDENSCAFDPAKCGGKKSFQCIEDSDCAVNICECKADLVENIKGSDLICDRFCPGTPKCRIGICTLITE